MNYISLAEYCEKYKIDRRNTTRKIQAGRIPGAQKIGKQWVIPEDAPAPADARQTSGKYKNWRNKGRKAGTEMPLQGGKKGADSANTSEQ